MTQKTPKHVPLPSPVVSPDAEEGNGGQEGKALFGGDAEDGRWKPKHKTLLGLLGDDSNAATRRDRSPETFNLRGSFAMIVEDPDIRESIDVAVRESMSSSADGGEMRGNKEELMAGKHTANEELSYIIEEVAAYLAFNVPSYLNSTDSVDMDTTPSGGNGHVPGGVTSRPPGRLDNDTLPRGLKSTYTSGETFATSGIWKRDVIEWKNVGEDQKSERREDSARSRPSDGDTRGRTVNFAESEDKAVEPLSDAQADFLEAVIGHAEALLIADADVLLSRGASLPLDQIDQLVTDPRTNNGPERHMQVCLDSAAALLLVAARLRRACHPLDNLRSDSSSGGVEEYVGVDLVNEASEETDLAFQAELNKAGAPHPFMTPRPALGRAATMVTATDSPAALSRQSASESELGVGSQQSSSECRSPEESQTIPVQLPRSKIGMDKDSSAPLASTFFSPPLSVGSGVAIPPMTAPNPARRGMFDSSLGGGGFLTLHSPQAVAGHDIWAEDKKIGRRHSAVDDTREESFCKLTLDDMEFIKPISRGGFGGVILARLRCPNLSAAPSNLPKLFAIKMLSKTDMLRKNLVRRVLAERQILSNTKNPFVVQYYCSFQTKSNLYLVMEYLPGGDLFSLLRVLGAFEEDMARQYVAETVLALEYLHSEAIVHRDIKPDNIMIDRDGHIRLTDFGLSVRGLARRPDLQPSHTRRKPTLHGAKSTLGTPGLRASYDSSPAAHRRELARKRGAQSSERIGLTTQASESHFFGGTPDYLAPEIVLGKPHSYAVDWWALGVMLYEILTGCTPFNAQTPAAIFRNILRGEVVWPEGVSVGARDLCTRLLDPAPDTRLGSHGTGEVMAHPFFEGVDWSSLRTLPAPFVPSLDEATDTGYFEPREELHPTTRASFLSPIRHDFKMPASRSSLL